jgi:hypothetical protein
MTTEQFCQSADLTPHELNKWLEIGLVQSALTRDSGRRREFTTDQLQRVRLLRAIHNKGVTLRQLARADLADLAGKAFVVFDGQEVRACRDVTAAIAAAVRARRWCCVIDLSSLRIGVAE